MSKILDSAVQRADDESWTFQCPGVAGSPCGDLGSGRPFVSSGWPTKTVAQARGEQHFDEHKLGAEIQATLTEATAELPDDQREQGLTDEQRDKVVAAVVARSQHSRTPSLEEFHAEHGLAPHPNGIHAVRIEDLP